MTRQQRQMDKQRYEEVEAEKERQWEALCASCGGCCGINEDPCENLYLVDDGRYLCKVYEYRLGMHKTVSGEPFNCVPVRNVLSSSWSGDSICAYKNLK